MQPMHRGDGSYRRSENCETTVSKGDLNIDSYPLRCCSILASAFPSLMWVF